jgi:D-amino-acid oxidase
VKKRVAVVGAGVSGLTTAIVFAERGHHIEIFADETGQETTSAAAAAIWFPYDTEPAEKVVPWALETYKVLADLTRDLKSGVSMIELRQYSRTGQIQIPDWAHSLGARPLAASPVATALWAVPNRPPDGGYKFSSGFSLRVPLMDTTVYLDYLRDRLMNSGGLIHSGIHLQTLEDVDSKFQLLVNCSGFGAKSLVHDADLEPHRGQVAIVPKIDNLECAIVCDDTPLMYAIPRRNDSVFGGTNEVSEDRRVGSATTARIVAECSRVLKIGQPKILAEKVGLRPFRKSGVRVEAGKLNDGRTMIHNYGHGGAGFTLSWSCAREASELAAD